jgi:hypothetical protein
MKMIGVSLSVLLLLCLCAYESRGGDLARGLVAHWTFDEGDEQSYEQSARGHSTGYPFDCGEAEKAIAVDEGVSFRDLPSR